MRVLFVGPQGSGKTTQAIIIAEDLKIPHFSTGRFLRKMAKQQNKVGNLIRKHLSEGSLIPDALVMELVDAELANSRYKNGFVIEGNPRTITQARDFKHTLDCVICLKLSDKECIKRLLKRKRADDTEKLIKIRLNIYHKETEPMLEYYEKKDVLHEIDARPSIGNIHKAIAAILGVSKHESHTIN